MTLEPSHPYGHAPMTVEPELDASIRVENAIQPVQRELQDLNDLLATLTKASTRSATDVVSHVFNAGGKRVRPALFFLSAKLVGYDKEHLMPMAAVCEFVHTASLLHDDVIDNSSLRRNKPTANSIWGDQSSVLVGDLIYARASEIMASTGSLEIVSLFAEAIRLMSEGELLQLENAYSAAMTRSDYFQILTNKTAVLLAASCSAPAILAGSSSSHRKALAEFGSHIGHAFQLLDDALDYAGSTMVFGKKTLSDLPEGKVTLPIILLREQATSRDWSAVESLLASPDSITHRQMLDVLELVNHYDTAGQTLELAHDYTTRALECLEVFETSAARSNLSRLAKSLLLRTN